VDPGNVGVFACSTYEHTHSYALQVCVCVCVLCVTIIVHVRVHVRECAYVRVCVGVPCDCKSVWYLRACVHCTGTVCTKRKGKLCVKTQCGVL